jgi:hypothetical protein
MLFILTIFNFLINATLLENIRKYTVVTAACPQMSEIISINQTCEKCRFKAKCRKIQEIIYML